MDHLLNIDLIYPPRKISYAWILETVVWKRVTPSKNGTFGNFHVKFPGCFGVFCLRCKPLNLPRGNGQRFAPTSDVSTRLYRDDLVDLLFTKAKVPGFLGGKNA